MITSNYRSGIARLMTFLWVVMWPASMALNIWVFIAFGIEKWSQNIMLYTLLAIISYNLTIGSRAAVSEKLSSTPFITLFDWIVVLLAPYLILIGIVKNHQHGEDWHIISAAIVLFYLIIAWGLIRGLIWVIKGFFSEKNY